MYSTPKLCYRIRYATASDVDAVIALRSHAETWLREAGIKQWTVHATGVKNIRASIAAGTTYIIITRAGETIGSLTLDVADLDFWTPLEASQPALYLYKFILSSAHRGNGLGDILLDWACEHTESVGARWLRLDCWKNNTGLHRYYEARGFRRFDTRDAPGRESGALFERSVDLRLVEAPHVELSDETTHVSAQHHAAPSDQPD